MPLHAPRADRCRGGRAGAPTCFSLCGLVAASLTALIALSGCKPPDPRAADASEQAARLPTPGANDQADAEPDRRSLRDRRREAAESAAEAEAARAAEATRPVNDDPLLDGGLPSDRRPMGREATDSLRDLVRELPPELNIMPELAGREPDAAGRGPGTDRTGEGVDTTPRRPNAPGRQHLVKPGQSLISIIEQAGPGDEIILWSGTYRGLSLRNVHGAPGRPIVIRGLDPDDPPVIEGGAWGIRMLGASHVELRDLVIVRPRIDGIEIAPDETTGKPVGPIEIVRVKIEDVGERAGRHGVRIVHGNSIRMREVTVHGWTGSAVELVGCHDVIIERCVFEGRDRGEMIGLRLRAGTADAVVRRTVMARTGRGGIVLGGRSRDHEHRMLARYADDGVRWEVAGITLDQVAVTDCEVGLTLLGLVDGSFNRMSIVDPTRAFMRFGRPQENDSVPSIRNAAIDTSLFFATGADVVPGEYGAGASADGLSLGGNLWWRSGAEWTPETDFPGYDSLPQRTNLDPELDAEQRPQAPDAKGFGAY
ncbi:MAG: hypothetical protein AB8G96_05690 [Phycisphaerales bacterium]